MHLSPVERDGEPTLNLRFSPTDHDGREYLTSKAGLEKAKRPASREDRESLSFGLEQFGHLRPEIASDH